jgi:hypothetical protein
LGEFPDAGARRARRALVLLDLNLPGVDRRTVLNKSDDGLRTIRWSCSRRHSASTTAIDLLRAGTDQLSAAARRAAGPARRAAPDHA